MTADELRAEIVRLCRERWPGCEVFPINVWNPHHSCGVRFASYIHVSPQQRGKVIQISDDTPVTSQTEALTRLLEKVREKVGSDAE